MKIVVALEDLKINAMYKVEGKKESFLKKILIKKGSIFSLCINFENSTKYSIQGTNDEIMYRTNDLGGQVMEVNLLYSL